MDLMKQGELKRLLATGEGMCVSIYMPTEKVGTTSRKDRIVFKNALNKAEELLKADGMRAQDARDLIAPARVFIDDYDFWQHQSDGLAVFLAPGNFKYFRVPLSFNEIVKVGKHFYIKPLLPMMTGDGKFYILALSQNEIRLLQGTQYNVSEVHLSDVPANLAEVLKYDTPENNLQFHTSGPVGGRGERAAIFYGHGSREDVSKDNIHRYFQQIDKGLHEILRDEDAPLILAGVDYLLPIYSDVNKYPNLLDEDLKGNPETRSAEELHKSAWEIVQPYFKRTREQASSKYHELAGTGYTSDNIREIVKAADEGRVDTLFISLGSEVAGKFIHNQDAPEVHESLEPGDEDLLDVAATLVLGHSGKVYAIEPDEMPESRPAIAIYRY